MVIRPIKIIILLFLVALYALPVQACFGPKLFIGLPDDARGQVLTSLVAIYVKEKTGTETERVKLAGKDVLVEIKADKIDFGFIARADETTILLLNIEGIPVLASGPRILNDLQFTTVAPALQRLQRILKPVHIELILQDVDNGALPMAAARRFLMQERWI